MSPPQPQFIDLSTRESSLIAQAQAVPRVELAAQVPATTRDLYTNTAKALHLHSLPRPVAIDAESARWLAFLTSLSARVAAGAVSGEQRAALVAIWDRALSRHPAMRRPAVGISAEGVLQASWAFEDFPGSAFTLEIFPNGGLEWFFRDGATGVTCGTSDEPEHELPAEALELLVNAFAASSGTR